jgi:hypothetical protein
MSTNRSTARTLSVRKVGPDGSLSCFVEVGAIEATEAGRSFGAAASWSFTPSDGAPFRRIAGQHTTRAALLTEFVARHAALIDSDEVVDAADRDVTIAKYATVASR